MTTLVDSGKREKRVSRQSIREAIAFYAFASPWIIGFVLFTAGPMIASMYYSLTKYDVLTPPRFVGFRNYGDALFGFDQELFLHSLKVTTLFGITSVPISLVGAFLVSLLMNQEVRGIRVFRTIYYLPVVTSGVGMTVLWKFMFGYHSGLINQILSVFGIGPIPWLISPEWALPALVVMSFWGFGGAMIIYLAGFRSIPKHLYEAATLDGAGLLARFWYVTIPMISPIIFFNFIMSVIGSFQVFGTAFVMTAGGPGRATYFYMLYLYQVAFKDFRMGYGSALAWILFVIISVCTYIAFRAGGRWVYYESKA